MSPCRVPCHLGRMGLVVVGAGGDVVEAEAADAGAELVAEEAVLNLGGMSQTWGWTGGRKNCGDKFDLAWAESTGRRRQHDTLRSAPLAHGGPVG